MVIVVVSRAFQSMNSVAPLCVRFRGERRRTAKRKTEMKKCSELQERETRVHPSDNGSLL